MSTRAVLLVVLTATLLAVANGINWQGKGNMNQTVLDKIWAYINANTSSGFSDIMDSSNINIFVKGLSDSLNQEWHPAWNVVATFGPQDYDTVLYGYAFNNHWMWYNGIQHPTSPTYIVSIVVWKDYNCQTWKLIAYSVGETSGLTQDQKTQIDSYAGAITKDQIINDIWGTAYGLVKSLESNSAFSSGAYSIIMAQNANTLIFGYVCRVENSFYFSSVDYREAIIMTEYLGTFYLFQTR